MALPDFFSSTTLRTISATTGEPEARVRELAAAVEVQLAVGSGRSARLAATTFVELFARTFGSLRIVGEAEAVTPLEKRARAINPAITLLSGPTPALSVALNADLAGDVSFTGAGWWVGRGRHDLDPPPGAAPIGPVLAGVLAFNEVFRHGLEPVLETLHPRASTIVEWSALDWDARPARSSDLAVLPAFRESSAALVGCGAIGHAVSFVLGSLPPVRGTLDLIDHQTVSRSNLQRYIGTVKVDAVKRAQKVSTCGRLLAASYPGLRRHNVDWAGYRRRLAKQGELNDPPELVLVALDSAEDRRLVQGSLPRLAINGWTRTAECGVTVHRLDSDQQCLVCTYVSTASQAPALHDVARLVNELGLPVVRVIHLLAGASLETSDLRTIERSRKMANNSLEPWRGESLRPLYGELCGMANLSGNEREQYTVPFPQVSVLAGVLVAAQFIKEAAGLPLSARPLEVSLLHGPGTSWLGAQRPKSAHPLVCICKDETYLRAYRERFRSEGEFTGGGGTPRIASS